MGHRSTKLQEYKQALRNGEKWHFTIQLLLANGEYRNADCYFKQYLTLPYALLKTFTPSELKSAVSVEFSRIRPMRAVHDELYSKRAAKLQVLDGLVEQAEEVLS